MQNILQWGREFLYVRGRVFIYKKGESYVVFIERGRAFNSVDF